MPLTSIPAIDANICSGWTEQQITLFNKVDFYLAKLQAEKRKTWSIYSKLVGKIPWKANMGSTMKGVRKEPSPHLRQFAFPTTLGTTPKKDVLDVRELTATVQVQRHRFESPVMNFLPDFRDFMTDHVKAHGEDIEEKKIRFEDIFIRGRIFHQSPYTWIADRGDATPLTASPMGDGNIAGTDGKSTTWLQAMLPLIGQPGNLSLNSLNAALTALEVDLRVPPFKGSGGQPSDNGPLNDMFALVLSSEAFNNFIYDPFLLTNKNIQLDIVNQGFKANLFGRITCKLEDMPIRIAADGTFPAPELREGNPDAYNYGESVVNPDYQTAPYEVAFLFGAEGYKSLEVGPPPSAFSKGGGPAPGFGNMFWNGEIMISKNFLVPCLDDATGNTVYETNEYGEYLKFISQLTLGLIGQQKRNVLPIIFRRYRGGRRVVA